MESIRPRILGAVARAPGPRQGPAGEMDGPTAGRGWLGAGVLAVAVALAVAGSAAAPDQGRLALAVPSSQAAFAAYLDRLPWPAAQVPPASLAASDTAELRRAIEDTNAKWLAAFRRGDTRELASRYTADASVIPPDGVPLQGRERIAAYFADRRDIGGLTLNTVDVVRVGELAYETGTWKSELAAMAGPGDAGRYFAIWKADDDGSWSCKVGIWNSSREAPPAR